MQDRAASRTALAVLLLVLAIAGIGAAGPGVGWHAPTRIAGLTITAGLEVFLAALLLVLRRGKAATAGPAARLRAMLSALLVIGLIAIPAAAAIANLHPSRHARPRQRPPGARFGRRHPIVRPGHIGHGAVVSLRPLLVALLLVALLALLIAVWHRRRRAWQLTRAGALADDQDEQAPEELAKAVGSGRRALQELDDARAAIIGCYLAMEDSLAQAGAERGEAETPDELLGRSVAAGLVTPGPAGRLTGLFYEARFSSHLMPRSRRDEAGAALAALAADLPEPAASEAGP